MTAGSGFKDHFSGHAAGYARARPTYPDALFAFPKEERYIYSALLTVGAKTFSEIQKRIDEFREEIIGLAKREEKPDRVMQFNIQHFPRSHVKET